MFFFFFLAIFRYKTEPYGDNILIIDRFKNEALIINNDNNSEYISLQAQIINKSELTSNLFSLYTDYTAKITWRRGKVYYDIMVSPFTSELNEYYTSNKGIVTMEYQDDKSNLIYELELPIGDGIQIISAGSNSGLSYKGSFELNAFDFKAIKKIDLRYSL